MTSGPVKLVHPVPIADGRAGLRHVFVRDLVLPCSIGVHRHERDEHQRVRINLDLAVREGERSLNDSIANVVCYEKIVADVAAIIARGHVNLVETLAEDIAALCLEDLRVRSVRVRVEKLDILPNADSVGVEIERFSREA